MTPEESAAALLDAYGLSELQDPPIPVDELAEEAEGLDVQEHPDLSTLPGVPPELAATTLSGLLFPIDKRIWVAALEAARSSGRRRFTIAHEIGHWRLHHRGQARGRAVFCRPDEVDGGQGAAKKVEAEANRFAAALLMPGHLLRVEAEECRLNVGLLARRFEVSQAAMHVRLTALDLLPEYMR